MRCSHEASLYDDNCFITLTYSDNCLPAGGTLVPRDFQLFMHRLRKFAVKTRGRSLRFYACGEYGEQFDRPHYHALLLDFDFKDKTFWRKSPSGHSLYRSVELEALWPFGTCEVGAVSFESAAYVARYTVKKVTGDRAGEHYHRYDSDGRSFSVHPEFGRMSRRPGIGAPWLDRYSTDVYDFDYVIVRGVKVKPPKFYDNKFAYASPSEFEAVALARMKGLTYAPGRGESSPERLAVKEEIASSRLMNLSRSL